MSSTSMGISVFVFPALGIVLWLWLVACILWWNRRVAAIRADVKNVNRLRCWLRGNLLVIRGECAPVSPQAICVVNALERAFEDLSAVPAEALRDDLQKLQVAHNVELLRTQRQLLEAIK